MARQILILSESITSANRYARVAGLKRFSYRAVRSAGSIRGVRSAEVHILPDFLTRRDRHAILQELKFARSLDVYYVDPADFVEDEPIFRVVAVPDDTPVPEHHSAMVAAVLGHDTSGVDDPEVIDEIEETDEPTGEAEQGEDAAPAEEPQPRRRRTRCKDCEELHLKDEPCFEYGTPGTAEETVLTAPRDDFFF